MNEEFSMEEPLFKGQIHESQQFKLVIGEEVYKGVFLDGEIEWYQPQPYDKIDKQHLMEVEGKVDSLMRNLIQ